MEVKRIVIHCSDTPANMDIGVHEITQWHTDPRYDEKPRVWRYMGNQYPSQDLLPDDVRGRRGNGWSRVGYHWVIRRDGTLESGVPEQRPGIHARGYNSDSLAVCLVGGSRGRIDYTPAQWACLASLVKDLAARNPTAQVVGHSNLDASKTCPNFDVDVWWEKHK